MLPEGIVDTGLTNINDRLVTAMLAISLGLLPGKVLNETSTLFCLFTVALDLLLCRLCSFPKWTGVTKTAIRGCFATGAETTIDAGARQNPTSAGNGGGCRVVVLDCMHGVLPGNHAVTGAVAELL
jgi:hypothetical protein